jgi:hypothetical protein
MEALRHTKSKVYALSPIKKALPAAGPFELRRR